MDELNISGKRYVSSRRIAKENGYHTDYIGQLIRGNKIKGQKVGRTWYVEADSFAAYLGEATSAAPAESAAAQASDFGYAVSPTTETAEVLAPSRSQPAPSELAPAPVAQPSAPIVVQVAPGHIPSAPLTHAHSTPIVTASTASAPSFAEPTVQQQNDLAAHAIPLRKIAPQPAETGLRYVADEPRLPEISRKQTITRQMPAAAAEEEAAYAPIAAIERAPIRAGRALALIGVAAVAIFAISALVSSGLLQTINVEAGNPASVEYSIGL